MGLISIIFLGLVYWLDGGLILVKSSYSTGQADTKDHKQKVCHGKVCLSPRHQITRYSQNGTEARGQLPDTKDSQLNTRNKRNNSVQ